MGFLIDVFSLHESNYSTDSNLADDVLRHLQTRTASIFSHLDQGKG